LAFYTKINIQAQTAKITNTKHQITVRQAHHPEPVEGQISNYNIQWPKQMNLQNVKNRSFCHSNESRNSVISIASGLRLSPE
jgi:hypothetical protein